VKESRRLMSERRNRELREEMRELSYYGMNEGGSSRSVCLFFFKCVIVIIIYRIPKY
jgi:hypothetical protein